MDANSTVSGGQADNISGRVQEITEQQGWTRREHSCHAGMQAQCGQNASFLQFHLECVHCDFHLRKILITAFSIKIPNF